MAQNPQRILGDIANQATQKGRETFEQLIFTKLSTKIWLRSIICAKRSQ